MTASVFTVPTGAWDTHVHVLDHPALVTINGRPVALPHAPVEALDEMHRELGIDHAVIIDMHRKDLGGFVNLVRSNGRYRGVTMIDDNTSDADLACLADAGVRGARFYFIDLGIGTTSPDAYRRAVDRIARFGWHALLFVESKNLLANEKLFRDTPIPIVIDHLARIDLRLGLHQPALKLILDLQTSRETYVKVSSGDRRSIEGPPGYADDIPFVRRVIENDASRVLWATDWPHVLYKDPRNPGEPIPDNRDLLRLFFRYCRSQQDVDTILRDTPARLYQ